jgi:DNA-binding transcriptional regulator YdaS (Cro superfamily)
MDRSLIKALVAMESIRAQPGLLAKISRFLGVTRAAVAKWSRVPAERVLAVESVTGISRHDLRPDIYPPPDKNGEAKLATLPPGRKQKIISNAPVA